MKIERVNVGKVRLKSVIAAMEAISRTEPYLESSCGHFMVCHV